MTNTATGRNSNAKKHAGILIGIFLLGLGYIWGGLTVYKRIFPFEQMKLAANVLTGKHAGSETLPSNPNWQNRREQFEIFGKQADVVMIGDSITHGGHWEDMFTDTKIANRGIDGDRTDDVMRRLESIISVRPKKAFVMIGINDLNWGRSVDEVFEDYKKIEGSLTNRKIEVFVQSTLECSRNTCNATLGKIRELNRKLETYAAQQKLTFININDGLTSEQEGLLSEYTYDGTHLRGNGYVKWSRTIAPHIGSN